MKNAHLKELEFSKSETVYVFGVGPAKKYKREIWDFFVYNLKPKRDKKGYNVRRLLTEDARGSEKAHEKHAQIRYLPYGPMVSMNIIGNLTTIGLFTKELIFISIESQEITDGFKEQFNNLWKIAKK